MNREELIEEAATMLRHYGYGHLADAVDTEFGKAHTPTDDERVARLREAEAVIEDALPMLGLFRAWNVTPGQIENLHRILSRYDARTNREVRSLTGPDCRDGKHPACDGRAWDNDVDALANCGCTCHTIEHAPGAAS